MLFDRLGVLLNRMYLLSSDNIHVIIALHQGVHVECLRMKSTLD
jgi:hypothetical protein